ncbi:glycosyltransferase family 39 protein [Chloroflexota bacterium]
MKQKLRRLGKWEYTWLCLLVLVTLVLHFAIIANPAEPVFDEQYYIEDARDIISGDAELRAEHPPLGELLVALGILIFGDNPFGWRTIAIVFGTISIFLLYLICRRLNLSQKTSFLAVFLLAVENQSFNQASVAMLDVYSVTFTLAAFWLYLRGNYAFSGVAICLSTLAKLSGALTLPAIALHWLITRRDRRVNFIASMALAPLLFIVLIPLCDLPIVGHLANPLLRIKTILTMSGSVTLSYASHPYATRPWEWLIIPGIMPYWYVPHYTAAISFTLWALIIPIVIYMAYRAWKGDSAGWFVIAWFASTYLVWIPLALITDRITYVYYFYPTVGAICIGVGLVLSRLTDLWKKRLTGKLRWAAISAVLLYLLLHVAIFAVLSPMTTWWTFPIPP